MMEHRAIQHDSLRMASSESESKYAGEDGTESEHGLALAEPAARYLRRIGIHARSSRDDELEARLLCHRYG